VAEGETVSATLPASRRVKLLRSRVLHMSINPKTGEMDVLLRVSPTDLADRNAIHAAMKRGVELALAYHAGDEGPVYEAGP
jgi:hypothetical protein